jgi:hypothetical protein
LFISCFIEVRQSNTPPNPIANAPIAKGLMSGAKLAAVPVVPQNTLATKTAMVAMVWFIDDSL